MLLCSLTQAYAKDSKSTVLLCILSLSLAAQGLKSQLEAQRKALQQLQANVSMLEARMNEARNKRETLKARAASAKSSKQIQEVSHEWRPLCLRFRGLGVQCFLFAST